MILDIFFFYLILYIRQEIWIKNLKGDMVEAICVSKPPHFMSDAEKNKPLTIDDLLLDVGAAHTEISVYKNGNFVGYKTKEAFEEIWEGWCELA